jgi:ATP-dependent RNA helicase DHX57
VILGGLWPQVAEVRLPKSAVKFDQVAAGTVQRENSAVEFRVYDLNRERVFIHPGSVLFSEAAWKPPFVCYFTKHATKKTYLRDCTQVSVVRSVCTLISNTRKVPFYGILLLGGTISVNHVGGGITVGKAIKLRASPRIGVLVTQLR